MQKQFSRHAVDKIQDIVINGRNHVGSQLKISNPQKYANGIASDCITMAIWVLQYAFRQQSKNDIASRVGSLGEKGTELARYLIEQQHWKAVYYNPDVNHPLDGSGEHIVSYYQQVKKHCSYSVDRVPVTNKVINYRPSGKIVTPYLKPTEKVTVDYDLFKSIPFGVGMSRGGTHVWLYASGKVYESHWDREFSNGLYTAMPLNQFPWLSGIVVVPPDSHSLLKMAEVRCKKAQ
ncbi:MAG: hypothetical protein K6L73_03945 [Cellvibrionaceae bacterium]